MHIIPVIDLLNGIVVHAKRGERSHYGPITSLLTKSTNPVDIVKAFMAIHPFKTLYIADLNAIQSIENLEYSHIKIIEEIQSIFPELVIWIDAGINDFETAKSWQNENCQLVLGSESFSSFTQYQLIASNLGKPFTLSLDFNAYGYMGPNELLDTTDYWPHEIIAMTLVNVGTNTGADMEMINRILSKAKTHSIFAAGGIRNIKDLLQLKKHGVQGALIASALHHKQIISRDLDHFLKT